MNHEEIIHFWFDEIEPKQHFEKSDKFDRLIEKRFGKTHRAATQCELYQWRNTPEGRLAEIIVLDQFSRNMFRDKPTAFAYDALALMLAQEAVAIGDDAKIESSMRAFLYMPYMHSESAIIHTVAVELFTTLGNQNNLDYEYKHKAIIDRFGRYPYRNEVLERESTTEEIEFLNGPESSF